MELYLFRHSEFDRIYNCSVKTDMEWAALGVPNAPFGLAVTLIGTLLTLVYIPCLFVIIRSDLMRWSAYKLMVYVGINDVFCLSLNSLITGYLSIVGAVACPHLDVKYIAANSATTAWVSVSVTAVLLSLNRCIEMWRPRFIRHIFDGRRTYFWIAGTVVYSLYFYVKSPGLLFSSRGYNWFFDPYYNIEEFDYINKAQYGSKAFLIHNFAVAIILPLVYLVLVVSFWWNGRHGSARASKV
uniref:G_PROTEIN_RECEP_F1_2 domain-containing protein n=1 Tax=Steinernema glaseri TaxID=37863 RepID=A0A1I7XYB5_9BILA